MSTASAKSTLHFLNNTSLMMKIIDSINALKSAIAGYKAEGKTIAFVPTMGNLHQGHLSLVKQAQSLADYVVVSIFVNPTQFGPNEDLDAYPRTLQADIEQLNEINTDLLFTPTAEMMYPFGKNQTTVSVPELGQFLCGASRPGHFDGVTTVVNKLFNLVEPNTAVFGEKDFQQLAIIKRMVRDMNTPISIAQGITVRENDGLAMSSRNNRLKESERSLAPVIYKAISDAAKDIQAGNDISLTEKQIIKTITNAGLIIDYCTVCDAGNLVPATKECSDMVIAIAAKLGDVRLIDNVHFSVVHG